LVPVADDLFDQHLKQLDRERRIRTVDS
jgi:hypothetical protein